MPATSSSRKAWLAVTGVCLGSFGIIACIAAMIILWIGSVHLYRVTERLFGNMNQSLVAIQQRIAQTQGRLSAAAATTKDIEAALRGWAQEEVEKRLSSRQNAVERIEKLAAALQQADQWLEIAGTSATLVQQLLSFNSSTSVAEDSAIGDRLIDGIASVRAQLPETIALVNNIRTRLVDANQQDDAEGRHGTKCADHLACRGGF